MLPVDDNAILFRSTGSSKTKLVTKRAFILYLSSKHVLFPPTIVQLIKGNVEYNT